MRLRDSIRSFFQAPEAPEPEPLSVEDLATCQFDDIALLARGEQEMALRLSDLTERHEDLVRQVGIQQAGTARELSDLRNIITQLGEQAKQKPAAARNMAEIRRFTGDNE